MTAVSVLHFLQLASRDNVLRKTIGSRDIFSVRTSLCNDRAFKPFGITLNSFVIVLDPILDPLAMLLDPLPVISW